MPACLQLNLQPPLPACMQDVYNFQDGDSLGRSVVGLSTVVVQFKTKISQEQHPAKPRRNAEREKCIDGDDGGDEKAGGHRRRRRGRRK